MECKAFEETHIADSILFGKDFPPTVGDFVHIEYGFVPTQGYLAHKEDSFTGRFDTALP